MLIRHGFSFFGYGKVIVEKEWASEIDKSPVSGGRLPYGSTCLSFSPFTYIAFGGDRHMHAGVGFGTCSSLIGRLACCLSDCRLLLVLGEAARSCCLTAKHALIYNAVLA